MNDANGGGTIREYALPVAETSWTLEGRGKVVLDFDYDEGRKRLLDLYELGKRRQWLASERIDWAHDLHPDNPLQVPESYSFLYGSDIWNRLSAKEKGVVQNHVVSWQYSQFLHGEQGALVCASKIVESVPDLDAKLFAATQVIDEARHVEVFSRVLRDKLQHRYPINSQLRTLLDQVITDGRWDFVYLGMQILIEGLALAAFGLQRDSAGDPLIKQLNAYVMQDEARHVAFGRLTLRDYYPELTEKERDEREEFVVEACYLMRDRFLAEEVWDRLGFDTKACAAYVGQSERMQVYRKLLFTRIVPTVKDIGLWGDRVQTAYRKMGVLDFAAVDLEAQADADQAAAIAFDEA